MVDTSLLLLPFFQRALVVGLVLGVVMAILGVIVVLRHMSFFADAIGHSALTGIALGILLQLNPFVSALVYSLLVATGIAIVKRKSNLSMDTLLGVFFSASVAIGVILIQLTPGYQTDLIGFLFGDILTVSNVDVILAISIAVITGVILIFTGKTFIIIAFDASLAQAEGTSVAWYELILLLILASVIALAIKLLGIILVTAMLVIPAASAHNITRSLTAMFATSALLSIIAVTTGMLASAATNTASGPTIILVSALLFALSLLVKPLIKSSS